MTGRDTGDHIFLALTNAVPGKEDEFNRFYDEVHVPDVLGARGWIACQRYKLTDEQRSDMAPPFQYLALYEVDLPVGEIMDAVAERPDVGPGGRRDPPLWTEGTQVWIYTKIGERQVNDDRVDGDTRHE